MDTNEIALMVHVKL